MSEMFAVRSEPPKKLKPQEWERYNPAWIDCTVEKFPFKPITNDDKFRYLWVVKPPERLILGIEFDDVPTVRKVLSSYGFEGWLEKQRDEDLHSLLGMGHPTLSTHFNHGECSVKSGEITSKSKVEMMDKPDRSYGEAFYGGELNFRDGAWQINNYSGRHSGGKADFMTGEKLNVDQWTTILNDVKQVFLQQMNLDVSVEPPKIK